MLVLERATAVLSGPGPLVGRITRGPPGPLAARRRHRLSKGRRHDYSGRRPRLEFSAEAASRRGQPTHRRRAAALAASRAHANPVAAEGGGASAWEELNPRGGALESNPPFLPLCGDESAAGDLPQLPARKVPDPPPLSHLSQWELRHRLITQPLIRVFDLQCLFLNDACSCKYGAQCRYLHASPHQQQQQQQQQAKPNPFGFGTGSRQQQQPSFGSQFQQQQQQQQKPNPFGFGVQGANAQSRNAPGPAKVCQR